MSKLRIQKIRTKVETPLSGGEKPIVLGGWLSGKTTYLRFGDGDEGYTYRGSISGQKLYRLAKAIIRHMDADSKKVGAAK